MYAVVDDKGKQYKVTEGEEILLDYFEAPAGELRELDNVLLVGGSPEEDIKIGRPQVEGARVLAEVVGHERGPKVRTVRFKGPSETHIGHRQDYTRVKIKEIYPDWGVENGS